MLGSRGMDPKARRAMAVLGLTLVVVVLLWVVWLAHSPTASQHEPTQPDAPPPASPARSELPTTPPLPPRARKPGEPGRTELPRPSAPSAETPKPLAQPPADRPMPVDRRGTTSPRAQHELEVLSYGFETLDEDLQACLDQWAALDPKKTPEVMLGFELEASGLTRSFVEGDDEVPFGPKTCLANAVYGIDWSHIVDHPAKVTKRFTITERDAGPAP